MPTQALKDLVIPVLNCQPFTFDIRGNADTVTFTHKFPQFISHWRVVDYPKSHVLSIEVLNIVSFELNATGLLERASGAVTNASGSLLWKWESTSMNGCPVLSMSWSYPTWTSRPLPHLRMPSAWHVMRWASITKAG